MFLTILKILSIFISSTMGNVFWGLYIKYLTEKNKKLAAHHSVFLAVCYLINLRIIIDDFWSYSIVYLLAQWIGTYYHQEVEDFMFKLFIKKK